MHCGIFNVFDWGRNNQKRGFVICCRKAIERTPRPKKTWSVHVRALTASILECWDWGLGFRVEGLGFRVEGLGLGMSELGGFRVAGLPGGVDSPTPPNPAPQSQPRKPKPHPQTQTPFYTFKSQSFHPSQKSLPPLPTPPKHLGSRSGPEKFEV